MRNTNNRSNTGGPGNLPSQQNGFNNHSGGYRGNRGSGYNNRGGGSSGYNRGGFQQPAPGGFSGGPMGGFQNSQMGSMPQYGGFQNRGGMMGGMRGGQMNMRGGRGGMGPNGMMGMPMGNMGMPNMGAQLGGMGMGMPQIGMQGMHGFPNRSSPPVSGQYASQAGSFGRPPPTSPAARQPWTYGMATVPDPGVLGFPTDTPAPSGSCASLVGDPAPAVSASLPISRPSTSASRNFFNPSLHKQSGTLKTKLSITGQGGFQGNQAQYNPAFFQQGQGGDSSWNPHGAKRTRQE